MTYAVTYTPDNGVINSIKIQDWDFFLTWDGRRPMVALKEICDAIGVNWGSQHQRLKTTKSAFNYRDIATVGADGKDREMVCLPIAELDRWLSGINLNKVAPETAERIADLRQGFFDTFIGSVVSTMASERDKARFFARKAAMTYLRKDRMASFIRICVDKGFTFAEIRAQGSTSWSKARLAEKCHELVFLGEIEALPPGTPDFIPPASSWQPEADQLTLFAEG